MKKNIVFTLYCFTVLGCRAPIETVIFSEPQPADKKALPSFPERLQGKYISNDETRTLFISGQRIVQISDYESGVAKTDLDTSYYLSGDTLINKRSSEREKITLRNDTIFTHYHDVDTLNDLTKGDVLKKFKGYYFLNQGDKENGWVVQRLALSDGKLTSAYISDSMAFNKLKELAEKPLDTVSKHYTITRDKFKVLLKSNGFNDYDTFTRIR
jgi:hypothetical protein